MNKVLMGLVLSSLFAASSLLAAEKTVIDPKEKVHRTMLMKDMRSMLDAMEEIQKGGLYSSTEDMKSGVKKLQGTLKVLESNEIKFILPKDQVYAYKFAQKTASMLRLYSDDMIASIEAGRMDDALEDYTQLLKQCTSCHIRIRNW
ncbi:MAG: hypothetical protein JHC35_04520 [Sulfuricurvum sp.]|jgi:cytochrome c556|uniref:hypothetical protein n=1 Tax=Sulfuricurvum sp. TaxID=2025608 RepID=UPI0025FAC0C5|nr:hypothetical protein [Sulfuricurvum sp.]MCI4406539.1 hypothetical protein [Sulfuricurvum sp.]